MAAAPWTSSNTSLPLPLKEAQQFAALRGILRGSGHPATRCSESQGELQLSELQSDLKGTKKQVKGQRVSGYDGIFNRNDCFAGPRLGRTL